VLLALILLTLQDARALVRAGVVENDRAKIVEGVAAYYHVSEHNPPPHLIADAYVRLATARDNDELARALLGVRFFEEAALIAAPDSDVARYAAMLQRMRALTQNARQREPAALRRALGRELATMWPKLSFDAAVAQMEKEYGGVLQVHGRDALIAHKILDKALLVDQYGHKGRVRFVVLDGVVSNGEGDRIGGTGNAKAIYQVRPPFADGPLWMWDRVQAKTPATQVGQRLQLQYLEQVLAATQTRDAFIARIERDAFHYIMVLHEGRHAIDDALHVNLQTWELEYRAKLSQVALTETAARVSAADIFAGPKDDTPHGRANAKLVRDLTRWMKTNAPHLTIDQFDQLTDEQIRGAFRSLDPLAKGKRPE